MRVTFATEPTPGRGNEDYVVAGPHWAVLLDGATAPPDVDSGCIHDVAWLAHRLGAEIARSLALDPDESLADLLADAIGATMAAHADTCDLTNPDSPSSTVAMIRQRDSELDYLALSDSSILIDFGHEVLAVTDDRTAHLPDYSVEGVGRVRNTPEGFWVASTKPEAAHHAVTGTAPIASVRRAALLSDGASRYVDRYNLGTWNDLLNVLDRQGPAELIRQVRTAETAEGTRHRGKLHDDATAALVVFGS